MTAIWTLNTHVFARTTGTQPGLKDVLAKETKTKIQVDLLRLEPGLLGHKCYTLPLNSTGPSKGSKHFWKKP